MTRNLAISGGCLHDSHLRNLERKALKVKRSFGGDGCMSDSAMREGLTDQAYLATFGVLDLVAEVRRLRNQTVSADALLGEAGAVIRTSTDHL